MTMTKKEAIAWAGNGSELARRLEISHVAVVRWPDKKPIPKLREYQLREMIAARTYPDARVAVTQESQ